MGSLYCDLSATPWRWSSELLVQCTKYSTITGTGIVQCTPSQQDQFLSFLHTFLPKSVRVGGWRPPTGQRPLPLNGKSWIRHCSYLAMIGSRDSVGKWKFSVYLAKDFAKHLKIVLSHIFLAQFLKMVLNLASHFY